MTLFFCKKNPNLENQTTIPTIKAALLNATICTLGSLSFATGIAQAAQGQPFSTARLLEGYFAIAVEVLLCNWDFIPSSISPYIKKITGITAVLGLLAAWFFVDHFQQGDAIIKDKSTQIGWSGALVCLAGLSSNMSFLLGWYKALYVAISEKRIADDSNQSEADATYSQEI